VLGADRNNVDVEVALAALLFAPFREFRMSGGYKTKATWRIRRVGQLSEVSCEVTGHDIGHGRWSEASSSLA